MRLRYQFLRGITAGENGSCSSQFFSQLEHGQNVVALRCLEPLQLGSFDIGRMPAHIELTGQTCCRAHRLLRTFVWTYASQDRALGVPYRGYALLHTVTADIVFHMFGRAAQGNFAQRNQIPFTEEVLCCALGLLRQVDLASFESCYQLIGRHVHQDHFVGTFEHRVGNGLVYPDAGDRPYRVIQTFEMLHIECRPDVDARVQQLLYILPTLGMARALYVGMGQLVHQQHLGLARQCGVQVELAQGMATVGQLAQWQLGQPREQLGGFAAPMRFHHARKHITPGLAFALRGTQHRVGLSNTRVRTEVDAQLAAPRTRLLAADLLQQLIGVRAKIVVASQCDVPYGSLGRFGAQA